MQIPNCGHSVRNARQLDKTVDDNAAPAGDSRRVLRALARFGFWFVLIWCFFYALDRAFPYIDSGSRTIYDTKIRQISKRLFTNPNALHFLFLGDSKVLAGLVPELFDSLLAAQGRPVESYNLGLPRDQRFVHRLAQLCAAGNVPDYIVITTPWDPDASFDLFHVLDHDAQLADTLFPFRLMIRDFTVFLLVSRHRGFVAQYETNRRYTEQMLAARGYFFIAAQSYYPGDRLPVDFIAKYDTPELLKTRVVQFDREFRTLYDMLEKYHIHCFMVPTYFRQGEYKRPPSSNHQLQAALAPYPMIRLTGPDYVLLANRYFSDPTHVNPTGARWYTRYIAGLVVAQITFSKEAARGG
jgi:hypothetical protein